MNQGSQGSPGAGSKRPVPSELHLSQPSQKSPRVHCEPQCRANLTNVFSRVPGSPEERSQGGSQSFSTQSMRGSASVGSGSMSQAYLRGELSRAKSEIEELRKANADLVSNMNAMDLRHTELIQQFLQKDNRVTDFLLTRAMAGPAIAATTSLHSGSDSEVERTPGESTQSSIVESRVVNELREKLLRKNERIQALEAETRRLTIDYQAKVNSSQEDNQRILQLLGDSQLEAGVYKERHDQLQEEVKKKDRELVGVRQRSDRLHAKIVDLELSHGLIKHECPGRGNNDECSL